MLKKTLLIGLIFGTLIFSGCGGGGSSSSSQSIDGKTYKGPFIKGSSVVAYRLNSDGSRSSTYITTTTTNDLGTYSFNSISWSGLSEIVITGNFLNENSGKISSSQISLSAVINILPNQKPSVKINVFTDLEAKRVKALLKSGESFSTAKKSAQNLISKMFGFTLPDGVGFEDLDPTDGAGANAKINAILLRISAVFADNLSLLKSLEKSIVDGNISNDEKGSLDSVLQKEKDVNLTKISQTLTDKLGIKNLPITYNHPPEITLNGGSDTVIRVQENHKIVTTITAKDMDGDTLSYSIIGGEDKAKFTINSNSGELSFINAPDFENPTDTGANNSYIVEVSVSDGSLSDTQTITVEVTNQNDYSPKITSNGGGDSANLTIAENNQLVTRVEASDGDGDTLSYSIIGGEDKAKFIINSSSGELSFINAPDFENPTDTGTNNSYIVEVGVSDGSLSDTQTITVEVTNQNEPPVAREGNITVAKDTNKVITIIGNLATDEDRGDSLTLSIINSPTNGTLIDNGDGTVTYTPNSGFIGLDWFNYKVRDSGGLEATARVNITVYPTYSGTANPGDFARFEIINNLLNYDVQGVVYGHLTGQMSLRDVTGNGVFFYGDIGSGYYVKVAKSENLGIFLVPTGNGNETVVLGLEVPQNSINPLSIWDKSYIYAEIGQNSAGVYVKGYIVVLNSNYSVAIYGDDGSTSNGCWKVINNHVVVKIDSNSNYCDPNGDYALLDDSTADVRVVIRPSTVGRAGFIADSVAGDFIGIGLEQKEILITEMSGTFDAYVYALDGSFQQFIQVEVLNDGTNAAYIETPYNCDDNGCTLDPSNQINGTLTLNKTCSGVDINGTLCASDSNGNFTGFIDTVSGYFMLANDNVLVFGSKQH